MTRASLGIVGACLLLPLNPMRMVITMTANVATPSDLVDISTLDPTLVIDNRYATANNFMGVKIYPDSRVFLRRDAATRLVRAHRFLRKSGMGLKVFDGYRPLSVQRRMWEKLPDERYVADPRKGSRHNRGCAVDVALVDLAGHEISMPSEYDDFSERAHWNYSPPSDVQRQNRECLGRAMDHAGFTRFPTEWWHYDAPNWEHAPVLDVNPYGRPLFPSEHESPSD